MGHSGSSSGGMSVKHMASFVAALQPNKNNSFSILLASMV
jgi:hypothetical protein